MIFPFNLFFARPPSTAAIVSTVRNAEKFLPSFLGYHLALGFSRIYLFFDSAADGGIEIAKTFPGVVVTVRDDRLEKEWRNTRTYRTNAEIRDHVETEVMARQILNAEIGLRIAREDRIAWLLHIDADELFYCPGLTVPEHFRRLSMQGCTCVKYWNHEAVPETSDIDDCFKEVTLFKRNRNLVKKDPSLPPPPDQDAPSDFKFYTNGKAAAKVTKSVLPAGVHNFNPAIQKSSQRRPQMLAMSEQNAPVILHYPCCSFESFWIKYTIRYYPDKWWGRQDISPFDRLSRDVVGLGDKTNARKHYEDHMVLRDPAIKEACLRSNMFARIEYPSQLLRSLQPENVNQSIK